jgi:hypothetical protein
MAQNGPSLVQRAWAWARQDRLHTAIASLGGIAALLLVVLIVLIAFRGNGQAGGPLIPRSSDTGSASASQSPTESPSPSASPSSSPTAATTGTATLPPARTEAGLAYDGATTNVVLFGGLQGQDPSGQLNDTWMWDGSHWSQQHPAQSPPATNYPVMAYDGAHRDVVLLDHGQTWTWNGSTWQQASPSHAPADPIHSDVMAYDGAMSRVILFGGSTGNETWSWDGSTWTVLQPPVSPSPRTGTCLAYDSTRQEITLFGGKDVANPQNEFNDTWTFDGTTWLPHTGLSSPPGRSGANLVDDAARHDVILFGGQNDAAGTIYNATWSWDGTAWQKLNPSSSPEPLVGRAGTYDGAHAQIVLFGGAGSDQVGDLNETWTWDGSTWTRRT